MGDQRKTLGDISFDTRSEWLEGVSYVISREEAVEAEGHSLAERKPSTQV